MFTLFTNKAHIRQLFIGLTASFSSIGYGLTISWISTTEPHLRSEDSPVGPLTDSQISWLGSLPSLGAIFGALIWSTIINKFGRKTALVLTTVPFFFSHLTLIFAKNYYLLLAPRFFCGTGVVGAMLNVPGYVAETCEDKIKSTVSSILIIIINFSTVIMYVIGASCTYFYINVIITIIPLALASLLIICIPESPVHFMKIGKEEKAKKQLRWLRASNNEEQISREYNKLKESFLDIATCSKSLSLSDIWNSKYYFRALVIGLILQSTISMSGIGLMTTYLNNILEISLQRSDTNSFAILVAGIQSCSSALSFFIFHKFNRKVFVVGLNGIVAINLFIFAVLLQLRSVQLLDLDSMVFIPLFGIYMLAQGLGMSTVVYVIVPELFAVECRNQFGSYLLFFHFSLHYILTKTYPVLVKQLSLQGWFFIFASYTAFSALFGYFVLPETKGKSIQYVFHKLTKTHIIDGSYRQTHKSHINTIS